ncbi:MAG: hypothetical protein HZB67_01855 [Candidatus Aenigmarchaeota archaeon]|nr:hypothetical protein [Candidatus Aenigmarchaeota archaeon]
MVLQVYRSGNLIIFDDAGVATIVSQEENGDFRLIDGNPKLLGKYLGMLNRGEYVEPPMFSSPPPSYGTESKGTEPLTLRLNITAAGSEVKYEDVNSSSGVIVDHDRWDRKKESIRTYGPKGKDIFDMLCGPNGIEGLRRDVKERRGY